MDKKIRVLITGINGFAASHLARQLLEEDCIVFGTVRIRSDLHRIEDIKDKLNLRFIELTDPLSVTSIIKEVEPDEIYHLAAQSYVRSSWDAPIINYDINVNGTISLLEACRKLKEFPKILNCSTSEVYGEVEGIINEDTFPRPNTHYGISKLTQDLIGNMYWKAYKMPIVTTRSFNVTGYGRAEVFVDSNFAKQIIEIEKGLRDPIIYHGNLESERDFVDVNDSMRGYILALRSKKWGEVFCFGTGKPKKIQYLLDTQIGLSKVKNIKTQIDPKRLRPIDTKTMKCDVSKVEKVLGWNPTIPFEDSMHNLLEYWREKL